MWENIEGRYPHNERLMDRDTGSRKTTLAERPAKRFGPDISSVSQNI